MTKTAVNPYLDGNFAPVHSESTSDNLLVIGELPNDLCGLFVRNGPNPQFPPLGRYHWFDGDGMLHAVNISNGIARYYNRYVQTKGWKIEHEAKSAIWTGLMEPPRMDNPYMSHRKTPLILLWYGMAIAFGTLGRRRTHLLKCYRTRDCRFLHL